MMDAPAPPDEELVRQAQAGDDAAMELLLHRHTGGVLTYATRWFSRDIAEEVAQDALLKAARNLETFKGEGSLKSWLLRICQRCCIDRQRHEQRQVTTVDLDDSENPVLTDRGDVKPTLSVMSGQRHRDQQQEAALRERWQEALDALPVEERLPVAVVFIDGYSQQEAAQILGIPPTTLRDRLIRGRKRLCEKFNDYRRSGVEHG
jgi:RNA polymerase sigma-70 factor, ECF subfamily